MNPAQEISHQHHSYSIAINNSNNPSKMYSSRVWNTVKTAFAETVASTTVTLGVVAYFATPISIPILAIGSLASFGLGCLSVIHDLSHQRTTPSNNTDSILATAKCLSRCSIVNIVGRSGADIAIHEFGHFLAVKALFKQANPKMWIRPFQGGATLYMASKRLTYLGTFFGKSGSIAVVAASGLAASGLYACSALMLAHKIRKSNPHVSQCIYAHTLCLLFHEVLYGLTAFLASKDDLAHDLIRLQRLSGIHPLIPIISLIALPLITLGAMHLNTAHNN